ncbi:L-glutamate gamma-semialdehyde dehydrogenase [Verminephrobacter eiseniae]|uniref:L-glutamate gamma-semialdehyde dehydrogenase n=1 Tax=Verminephrobacter eiseniae (strain EF01-2) TaxID=391735 RepID=A1WRX5_VEREI|nr:L-glutamate gamma-semialdehyde dehydrogenase [Verminephrobacter eiseniae]ABM60382.1 delta-1-pyrroline-5-carboxylate dehydrogenase [Verminephrobacter eiseniae EF01-2]MCW5285859.1 L-glutamate gamma-semialdehyde dehydrogenase [Verminephrobacter eiseniae]MCW5304157.1 L-glutamate gamma-semialdehyde dehydrogenase [Verminephrobacter eiseniae]MCW8180626.1 L-glutamate gamma-semialdehyde dehydrogenase [Verminephrobacter eiseniae]MCW8192083.1 L-glutamate gamma-semialdehyde dehydrogenase [Verminephroba
MNSRSLFPRPENEPTCNYAEGTDALTKLRTHLADRTVVEIPAVVGGKKIFSDDVEIIHAPHDRSRVLARVHRPSQAQVDDAIRSNLEAAHDWSRMDFADRAAIMHRAAGIVRGRLRHRINAATMLGQSKTLDEAEADSACELIDFLHFNTFNAQQIVTDQPLSVQDAQNRCDWRPLEGFVYAVSPFNFTAIGTNLSCAPALMGNTVLWKPSNKSTWSNYLFFEALEEAGLPPGVINFVPGEASLVTDAVFASRHFAGLHFTGSSEVFRSLWKRAATGIAAYRTFPRIVGETGGKDFVLVHRSADAREVAVALLKGSFGYQGQKCSAASRAYMPASLWPKVKSILCDLMAQVRIGDVADVSTFMGAVIDQNSYRRLGDALGAAKADSQVKVVAGGTFQDEVGYFVQPTVLQVEDPSHRLMKDELFGPVLSVFEYPDSAWTEVLEAVDSVSDYALTGSIFCTDRAALKQAQDALLHAAGNLYLNDKPTGAIVGQQPFGGGRASGTNDKAGSWMNLLRWTSPRVVKETYAPPRGL